MGEVARELEAAPAEPEELTALARRLRASVLRMLHLGRASHAGSNLSMVDILAVLYGAVMRIDPTRPDHPDRDRLIVSKGHAAAGLYAVLAERGFIPREWLWTFYQDGSPLAGHVTKHGVAGVELSTGALGHGLSVGTGMAIAAARGGSDHRVFVLLSDGECDEGSIWEAAMLAAHHGLDNLVVVVDYNKIQSLDLVERTLALEPFAAKWEAFGWAVEEVEGHDVPALLECLGSVPLTTAKPTCVIAHTIKGKGVSFMEGEVLWHYRPPSEDELERALAELDETT